MFMLAVKIFNSIENHDAYSEFYYNILGHSWDLEIDNFSSQIVFPKGIDKDNVELSLYSGILDKTDNQIAKHRWLNDNTLEVYSTKAFLANQGITLSASFPQDIITINNIEEPPSFSMSNESIINNALFIILIPLFVLPLFVLLIAWYIFKRHQKKNPYFKKTIVPQYEAPDNLSPIKLGYIIKGSRNLGQLITATIIRFASFKLITIADKEEKILFFKHKTLEFKKTTNQANYHKLDEIEKYLFDLIFKDKEIIETKDLRKILFNKTHLLSKKIKSDLRANDYLFHKTPNIKIIYAVIGIAFFFLMSPLTAAVMLVFYNLISVKTEKGERVAWKNKGFLMFLKVANTDRHRFYEKENIFTKLLPYAIAFNLTSRFLKEMANIYGEDQIRNNMSWYAGYSSLHSIESLRAKLNTISSQITSSTSSGRGGMGSSGGGRGGGGGGSW